MFPIVSNCFTGPTGRSVVRWSRLCLIRPVLWQPVGDPGDPGARPGESVTGFYRLLVWCDIVLYGVFVGMFI